MKYPGATSTYMSDYLLLHNKVKSGDTINEMAA